MNVLDAHGARIPRLGFGTGALRGEAGIAVIRDALGAGYRHLDTARSYGNEAEVGEAIRTSGVRREDIFLTTKVWPDRLRPDDLRASVEESVEALGVGAPDLLLIHWPNSAIPLRDTMRAFNQVKRDGLVRHLGLSNFTRSLLADAWSLTDEPLVANQCEYHPRLEQRPLIDACRERGMAFVAYMPLGRTAALTIPELEVIAQRHGRTTAQVTLRWMMQQDGVVAIPKSTNSQRMRDNRAIADFELSPSEMAEIFALHRPDGRLVQFPSMRRAEGITEFREFAPAWDS